MKGVSVSCFCFCFYLLVLDDSRNSSVFSFLGTRRESITGKYIYKDCDHFIREYDENFRPSVSDQFKFVSQYDKNKLYGGDECYLMSTEWLNRWVEFVRGAGITMGPISNDNLVERNEYGSYKLKAHVRVKSHFRPVNKVVWEYYFTAFGGGPIIAFHGNIFRFMHCYRSETCLGRVSSSAHWVCSEILQKRPVD